MSRKNLETQLFNIASHVTARSINDYFNVLAGIGRNFDEIYECIEELEGKIKRLEKEIEILKGSEKSE